MKKLTKETLLKALDDAFDPKVFTISPDHGGFSSESVVEALKHPKIMELAQHVIDTCPLGLEAEPIDYAKVGVAIGFVFGLVTPITVEEEV